MMRRCAMLVAGLGLALLLQACATTPKPTGKLPDKFEARAVNFTQLPGWQYDQHEEALAGFIQSCEVLARRPRGTSEISRLNITKEVWETLCANAKATAPNAAAARQFFERNFTPYQIANNGKKEGLFTGYYEPLLYGSYVKTDNYAYPLMRLPKGAKNFSRAAIDNGALSNHGLEWVWVDDPVMLFFMQIQGSGRVRMNDGTEFIAGYEGANGQPYVSLGKIMGDENLIPRDKINFFTIRQWLYDNPDKAFAMMQRNPSYIFFQKLDRMQPVGAIGVPVTPLRSIAIDSRYLPYGLPVFMETELPVPDGATPRSFNQLVIAHDTGGAIKGPVRADLFMGGGAQAEYWAGYMTHRGRYYLLLPKQSGYGATLG